MPTMHEHQLSSADYGYVPLFFNSNNYLATLMMINKYIMYSDKTIYEHKF